MRRLFAVLLLLAVVPVTVARAQDPEDNSRRADSLRLMIQDRFARVIQEQLGLTDDQAARMRSTAYAWFVKRRNMEVQERRLKQALAGQMRPGIAADQDSVARLTDALLELKIAQVRSYKEELDEMTYLTPIQRAQFFILRERLLQQVQNARDQMQERRRLRQ
ncbi:MAG: Spy/CpxP family protein refolding chaperone [Gemmatimonadales bacterium]